MKFGPISLISVSDESSQAKVVENTTLELFVLGLAVKYRVKSLLANHNCRIFLFTRHYTHAFIIYLSAFVFADVIVPIIRRVYTSSKRPVIVTSLLGVITK